MTVCDVITSRSIAFRFADLGAAFVDQIDPESICIGVYSRRVRAFWTEINIREAEDEHTFFAFFSAIIVDPESGSSRNAKFNLSQSRSATLSIVWQQYGKASSYAFEEALSVEDGLRAARQNIPIGLLRFGWYEPKVWIDENSSRPPTPSHLSDLQFRLDNMLRRYARSTDDVLYGEDDIYRYSYSAARKNYRADGCSDDQVYKLLELRADRLGHLRPARVCRVQQRGGR